MKMYKIVIKTDRGNVLAFKTDKYSKTDTHIEFTDIKGNYNFYSLSLVLEVSEIEF
jgi:hypothetical protein